MAFTVLLHNRQGEVVARAIVDDADVELVSQHSWHLAKTGYAATNIKKRVITLHRFLLQEPPIQVDHINRDKLDCRRQNMRVVTDAQNKQNVPARGGTSQYRGVSWDERQQKWSARFGGRGHRTFHTELEAARYISDWRRHNLPFSVEADICSHTS